MSLIHIAEGALEGTDTWTDVGSKIEQLVGMGAQEVGSDVESFVKQFFTDFGKQALDLTIQYAPQVISGALTINEAKDTVLPLITADAVTDAERDGAVVLDALRVHITNLLAAPPAPDTTEAQPAA